MPVGEYPFPEIIPIAGVKLAAVNAGIKQTVRPDLLLVEITEGASVAGVFTQNTFAAAPVQLAKKHLSDGSVRYLLVNSGNANACTGEDGTARALQCCQAVAETFGVQADQVLPFSTGVIGQPLAIEKIFKVLPSMRGALSADSWDLAAKAIMTTDTRPKGKSVQFEWDGELISVSGIAKGAGMIKPNMATMLGYIATDAVVSQALLDQLLKTAVNKSFNRITVDGDTSTNDSCVLIATGQAGHAMLNDSSSELYKKLEQAVIEVMAGLAREMVRDGEGVTKCVDIQVGGGTNSKECLQVAYSIAHSPLVKTALFASDPNWGRIIAAIGNAGVKGLVPSSVTVWLDDLLLYQNDHCAPEYTEELGAAVVAKPEFSIRVELGRGQASETVWTSDLSHDYVTINAEYRT